MKNINVKDGSGFRHYQLISLILIISFFIDLLNNNSFLFIPLFTAVLITVISTKWGIGKIKSLQLRQVIREEGPKEHYKKSGTPSMGGILIVPIGIIIGNLVNQNNSSSKELIAISILGFSFMLIGLLDDWRSIKTSKNKGLEAGQKVILQIIASFIFLIYIYWQELIPESINLLGNNSINLGTLFWPIALIVLLAESNATNLTDGLDGLASGCGAIVLTGLSIELVIKGTNSDYAMASFCMALAGAWLGFLIFNTKPAQIFMGDTGSLAMGAMLAGIAILSNTLWSLLIMGGIFLAESLSVIIQVGVFKITKKISRINKGYRIFLMAPIHHHLEIQGKKEIQIVQHFWLISIFFVFLGLILRSSS